MRAPNRASHGPARSANGSSTSGRPIPYGEIPSPPARGRQNVWPREIPSSPVVAIEIAV